MSYCCELHVSTTWNYIVTEWDADESRTRHRYSDYVIKSCSGEKREILVYDRTVRFSLGLFRFSSFATTFLFPAAGLRKKTWVTEAKLAIVFFRRAVFLDLLPHFIVSHSSVVLLRLFYCPALVHFCYPFSV